MKRTHTSTTRYLEHCTSSDATRIALLSKEFKDRNRYRDIANPIATIWLISFRHLSQHHPLAAKYLEFICFLAEKDIPTSLLELWNDPLQHDEAIGSLKGYAFITDREESDSFDIHRLVRLAMQSWLQNERSKCIERVLQRLSDIYPWPNHDNREIWIRYMPHAQAVLESRNECLDEKSKAFLLSRMGESYKILAKYEKVEQMYQEALEISEQKRGSKHPKTLAIVNNLARVFQRQGRYEKAERMQRSLLDLRKEALGQEHPSTLASMNNLAIALDKQRKYEEAEKIHRQTLELKEKVLGKDNLSTLDTRENLARVFQHQGNYEKAEKMYWQGLELRRKILGQEHPSVHTTMHNIAQALHDQEKYEEAEQIHRQVLEQKEKVLGREHAYTLDTMNHLARSLRYQENYSEAGQIYRQVIGLAVRVVHEKHHLLTTSRRGLIVCEEAMRAGD